MSGLVLTLGVGSGSTAEGGVPPVIQALARSVAEVHPTVIGVIASRESRPYASHLEEAGGVVAEVRVVSDPDDLEACFLKALRVIDQVCERGVAPEDLSVDVTSGTVAMRVGAALAAVSRRVPRYRVIAGERDRGLVRSGAEAFLQFEPAAVFAEEDVLLAEELIRRFRFGAAGLVLQRGQRVRSGRSRRRAALLTKVARVYQSWDLFAHEEALRTYRQAEREGELGEFALSDASLSHLAALARDTRSYLGVADLFANAHRRAEEGRFDDAVARLYRSLELTTQVALAECGLDAGDLDVSRIHDAALRRELEATASPDRRGRQRVRIGLRRSMEVLGDQGHVMGELLGDEHLRALLEQRNQSILAHGTRPVARKTFEELSDRVASAVTTVEPAFGRLVAEVQFPWLPSRGTPGSKGPKGSELEARVGGRG